MLRRSFVLSLIATLVGCGKKEPSTDAAGAGSAAPAGAKLKIAVIPKGTTHEFWKSVHAGAVKASRELGVEIVWKGPLKEDDLKSQIDLVQSFTAQGVSGMVLAPLNDVALGSSVKAAVRAKIPVVIFDSDLKGTDHTSFVATDNKAAGKLAGERLGKLLGGKGNVVLLRYQEGSASTNNREQGFLEGIKAFPEIKVVSDNQYGGATTESAYSASENLLLAQNAAKGNVAGIFAPNESTTFGMLLALQKAGLAGKVRFIGFDASDKLVAGVKAGEIDGLVLQNPFKMGYLAVKTMTAHLKGEKVEPRIDTGASLVDKENMEQPEMKELLKPDLKQWLD
ncbi:MAG TPA: substrate-binding domain-containing protein [Polyangiaceae bacterium]|nr:substrate-binding domain-containing protein [Polyangiaceae bacterium]